MSNLATRYTPEQLAEIKAIDEHLKKGRMYVEVPTNGGVRKAVVTKSQVLIKAFRKIPVLQDLLVKDLAKKLHSGAIANGTYVFGVYDFWRGVYFYIPYDGTKFSVTDSEHCDKYEPLADAEFSIISVRHEDHEFAYFNDVTRNPKLIQSIVSPAEYPAILASLQQHPGAYFDIIEKRLISLTTINHVKYVTHKASEIAMIPRATMRKAPLVNVKRNLDSTQPKKAPASRTRTVSSTPRATKPKKNIVFENEDIFAGVEKIDI